MDRLLKDCAAVTDSGAHFTWVPDEDLLAADVEPWSELPLWIPESDSRLGGMLLADNRRAVVAGLTFRPLTDTIRATIEWDRREGAAAYDLPIRVTPLASEREAELLARCV
jgi:2'-hydroxyisoflavone reductase